MFGAGSGSGQRGLLPLQLGSGLFGFAGQRRLVRGEFLHRSACRLDGLSCLFGSVDLFALFGREFFDGDFGLFEFARQLGAGSA
ncbi:hypothetical protein [Rivihabitans pingtungensis]|uniref:hypothetical protein n=1 Tax=Rivihabitans pingtungensis TaxID=1054498 RepID=UPI001FE4EB4F|nr:hypothetical protein [Rivihabitans pingtungensis]